MGHVAAIDKEEGTVIMIQIENEIGMLEDARDYSKEANALFNAPVPAELMSYLQKNKKTLHPQMLEKWESQGSKKQGTGKKYSEPIFTPMNYLWPGTTPAMWKEWHKAPGLSTIFHYT